MFKGYLSNEPATTASTASDPAFYNLQFLFQFRQTEQQQQQQQQDVIGSSPAVHSTLPRFSSFENYHFFYYM